MADIAAVFNWQPQTMLDMPLRKLCEWQQRAVQRWNFMHGTE